MRPKPEPTRPVFLGRDAAEAHPVETCGCDTCRRVMRPKRIRRVIHDGFHLAMLPFGVLAILGLLNHDVHEWFERVDVIAHLGFAVFVIDGLRDAWHHRRKHDD